MFDIRQNPKIPMVVMAVVAVCETAAAWAGCNTIPDAVCIHLGNPAGCAERIAEAQAEAVAAQRPVVIPELDVVVRPDGQVHPR